MVLLACSVSLRFFRFGGVPKMVLSGVAAGFLLYVLSKVTEDLEQGRAAARRWWPHGCLCLRGAHGFRRAFVPGGRVMAGAIGARPGDACRRGWWVALIGVMAMAVGLAWRPRDQPSSPRRNPPWVGIPPVPNVPTASSTLRNRPERSERADDGARGRAAIRQHQQPHPRDRQRPDLLQALDARSRPASSTSRPPSACAPKAMRA